jgi:hypothetical protein
MMKLFSNSILKFNLGVDKIKYIFKINHLNIKASLAQWQSTGLVNQGSWVQSSQEAVFLLVKELLVIHFAQFWTICISLVNKGGFLG